MPGPLKPALPGRKRRVRVDLPPIPTMKRDGVRDYGVTAIGFFAHGYVYGAVKSRPIPMEVFPADTPEKRLFVAGQVAATQDRAAIARGEREGFDCEESWLRLLAEKRAERQRQREVAAAAEAVRANPAFGILAEMAAQKR